LRRTKDELRKEVEQLKKGLEECFKKTEVAGKELRSWFEVETDSFDEQGGGGCNEGANGVLV